MILHLSDEDHIAINNFHLLNRYICKRNHLSYINVLKYYLPDVNWLIFKLLLFKMEKAAILLTP